jgi:hypothetical protein
MSRKFDGRKQPRPAEFSPVKRISFAELSLPEIRSE